MEKDSSKSNFRKRKAQNFLPTISYYFFSKAFAVDQENTKLKMIFSFFFFRDPIAFFKDKIRSSYIQYIFIFRIYLYVTRLKTPLSCFKAFLCFLLILSYDQDLKSKMYHFWEPGQGQRVLILGMKFLLRWILIVTNNCDLSVFTLF